MSFRPKCLFPISACVKLIQTTEKSKDLKIPQPGLSLVSEGAKQHRTQS